jgi:hypothetical protein
MKSRCQAKKRHLLSFFNIIYNNLLGLMLNMLVEIFAEWRQNVLEVEITKPGPEKTFPPVHPLPTGKFVDSPERIS